MLTINAFSAMYTIFLSLLLSLLMGFNSCEQNQVLQTTGIEFCNADVKGCNGMPPSACFYTCDDAPEVNYSVEPSNGRVKAAFPQPFCCHLDIFTVVLQVNENIINETFCNVNSTKVDGWGIHSKRSYRMRECESNGSVREKYGEVNFQYVFTGCYKLRIGMRRNGTTLNHLESCPHYIRTNYIKSDIKGEISISSTYSSKEKQLRIDIFPNFTYEMMRIEVNIKTSIGHEHGLSACTLVNEGTESNPDLRVKDQWNGACQHNGIQYASLICEKVPTGNYSITVIANADRCLADSIWTESGHCIWTYDTFGIETDDIPVVSVGSGAPTWKIVIIVIIIIGVHAIIIGILLIIRRQKQPQTSVNMEYLSVKPRDNDVNLLLLYPRDCFDFMKTMSTFRRLMERLDNIQVHDCHTTENDLSDPLDWLRKVMNYPKLRIIVVMSHCAFIQQEAIQSGGIENCNEIYKNPTFIDCIFPYALKQIMNDFSSNAYHKIHMIGFKGFSLDDHILALPSCLRRYLIPEHLQMLLSELNLENASDVLLKETAEYMSLLINIKNLRKYTIENPNYLNDILN